MKNIWVSSDWHLGHKNMVRGETEWKEGHNIEDCRNFESLKEHDALILKNINDNVKQHDVIYFLGDFCLGGIDNIYKYRSLILCENIYFVFGNHDHHIKKNKIIKTPHGYMNTQDLFVECGDILEKRIGKVKFMMCHYPLVTRHIKFDSPIILYGHFHQSVIENYSNNSPSMNVGIDTHPEFRPYHINEIKEIIRNDKNISDTSK